MSLEFGEVETMPLRRVFRQTPRHETPHVSFILPLLCFHVQLRLTDIFDGKHDRVAWL